MPPPAPKAPPASELQNEQLYAPVRTFMNVPYSHDFASCRAAILGVPFDCGIHPTRIGARLGPQSIRERSALQRPIHSVLSDFNPLKNLRLIDAGDVRVISSVMLDGFARIEEAVWRIVAAGSIPLTMGGDGAVTLPQLRALHRRYPDLCVLHLDAHTDAYTHHLELSLGGPGDFYNSATTFVRAAEERVVDTANSFHVGIRGFTAVGGNIAFTRSLGYHVIDGHEMFARGIPDVVAEIKHRLVGRPVYLCFDMDFFDPSCAPGVASPAWGGPSAREGLGLLQSLAGLNFVAFDVNTVSPPHDVQGMAAHLAGVVLLECMSLACHALHLTE